MEDEVQTTDGLAILGGKPIRESFLPYGRQMIDEADITSVVQTLKSDFLTTGPSVDEFEQAIATYVGAKYAVAFSNGTAALHGACFAASVSHGDEVITTPMTFAASANCILYMGGTPVFADIDLETYNISPNSILQRITPKTKAIIPVHYTGQPADMDEISKIARDYHLVVIEDGAHALGASYKGCKIGTFSDMTVFSLHPVKPITTGEGGIVTTNDSVIYKKLLQFRSHGIVRDADMLIENHGPWYHEMQSLGYNYRLTDIQAALGKSQLHKLDSFIARRREIATCYSEAFASLNQVQIPTQRADRESGWHLYILRLKLNLLKCSRKEIFEALRAENIGVNVHYIPVYYHPYYRSLGYQKGLCLNAENLYDEIITLPLFPSMTDGDVEDVVSAVTKVISFYAHKLG